MPFYFLSDKSGNNTREKVDYSFALHGCTDVELSLYGGKDTPPEILMEESKKCLKNRY